jgi:hypothetical protein
MHYFSEAATDAPHPIPLTVQFLSASVFPGSARYTGILTAQESFSKSIQNWYMQAYVFSGVHKNSKTGVKYFL